MTAPTIEVRDVREDDAPEWTRLYAGYREFYHLASDDEVTRRTWDWVLNRRHGLFGLVAVDETGRAVAFAHVRLFARPSRAELGLYLDDLFTSAEARGRGAATALLRRCAEIAREEGASVVRWITAEDNASARRLYDSVASSTPWVTYDMPPAE
jgi:ribosomal protein S18 acetylase RimI-like enzyme